MFKDLRVRTKFLILCGVCLVLTSVATYALLVEKQVAITFACSELDGSRYLVLLRPIYVAVLKTQADGDIRDVQNAFGANALDLLLRANVETAGSLQIENIVRALALNLRDLGTNNTTTNSADPYLAALKNLRELAARIGDDLNLTLDPVIDTYHVEIVVVKHLPAALEELGQVQLLMRTPRAVNEVAVDRKARFITFDTLLRAEIDGTINDLTVAQRMDPDGRLKQSVDPAITSFSNSANAYLDRLHAVIDSGGESAKPDPSYAGAVNSALDAWDVTEKQLDQLLIKRVDDLGRQRLLSLLLIGGLGTLGLLVALLTYRDMILPIKRLADLANTIRETKNYDMRFKYESRDEIGGLAASFDGMLGELAAAREREIMGQTEIARVSRLATMGAMVASIAHEIRQPLAAVAMNSRAGARWLAKKEPDLNEARTALKSIGEDALRANGVIASISAMFKKNTNQRIPVDINEVVNDVLNLSRGELRLRKINIKTELASGLPQVPADPIQLREVLLNLIRNAAEAMSTTAEMSRILTIASTLEADSVAITVEDSEVGIDAKNAKQIFEAFFTTKSTGMGMGLAICRSIIAAHDGRLWASPGESRGTVFHIVLPVSVGEWQSTG